MWKALNIVAGLFLIAFGGFVMSIGQADDSPGLGGLGLITLAIGVVMGFKAALGPRSNSRR